MAKWYDYVIEVSMRLKMKDAAPKSLEALREYLEDRYTIREPRSVADALGFGPDELSDEDEAEDELLATVQLQTVFTESQMDDGEPTEEALEGFYDELMTYLEATYQVESLVLLDDGFNSFLLGEHE